MSAAYEYGFFDVNEVSEALRAGWEPVPNVPVVYYDRENLPRTMSLRHANVFLRREIGE